jgi:hypothetical protein
VRRLKQLEDENRRLKQIVADLTPVEFKLQKKGKDSMKTANCK